MGRMTEKDASGRWQVKGLPWEKLQAGETLTEETSQIMYGCLCKLKDYEECGMSPDQLKDMQYKAEDAATHVCDKLCRYPREIMEQEELDEICERCPLNDYVKYVSGNGSGEQGKLLKLPVPIGSRVYEPYQFLGEGAWEIDVHKIRLEDLDKIGKTVFLTREEAEAALRRMGDGI